MQSDFRPSRFVIPFFLAVCALAFLGASMPDEGMWTFENPPWKLLKERYGFTPTQEWLDHIRLASVRFNDGGSGSFVSPTGLVLTNHHVALGQLQKVSTPQKDYVKDGFYAKTQAEGIEKPGPRAKRAHLDGRHHQTCAKHRQNRHDRQSGARGAQSGNRKN
jgi:hypothetical protein